jgi:VanZ family protein
MTSTPILRRTAWTLTALYASFHFVMTHLPPGHVPHLQASDKTLHFLSYGMLSGCFYLALWIGGMPAKRAGLMVMFVIAAFGVFDEILQAPVGRDPELLDWVADVSAAMVAVTCFSLLRAIRARRASAPKDAGSPLAVSQDL